MSKLQIRRGRTDSCGLVTHQLLSLKLAMEKVARNCGLPFLMSIPQTPDVGLLVGLLGVSIARPAFRDVIRR